jgi:hypothetical protein
MTKFSFGNVLLLLLAALALGPTVIQAQENTPQLDTISESGTVASSTSNTVVVRLENGTYQLYTFDRYTVKPATIPAGTRVRVQSVASDDPAYRLARSITVGEPPPAASGAGTDTQPSVVPPSIRDVENDIAREARRFRVGARAGVALDPEMVMVGAHAQMGPFFHRDLSFRPNFDFGFGEITTLFALNLEAAFRLPLSSRYGRWSAYAGVGPGFNFSHQNFERDVTNGDNGTSRIDFGDFNTDVGLNIFGGIQYRSGMFIELKTSVYSRPAPTLRILFGYNF